MFPPYQSPWMHHPLDKQRPMASSVSRRQKRHSDPCFYQFYYLKPHHAAKLVRMMSNSQPTPHSKLKRSAFMSLALLLQISVIAVAPALAETSDSATELLAANRKPLPEASWLVGVWKGLSGSCGQVVRFDGEVVAVLGAMPTEKDYGRPVRLQGRYTADSPCKESGNIFLVTAYP